MVYLLNGITQQLTTQWWQGRGEGEGKCTLLAAVNATTHLTPVSFNRFFEVETFAAIMTVDGTHGRSQKLVLGWESGHS